MASRWPLPVEPHTPRPSCPPSPGCRGPSRLDSATATFSLDRLLTWVECGEPSREPFAGTPPNSALVTASSPCQPASSPPPPPFAAAYVWPRKTLRQSLHSCCRQANIRILLVFGHAGMPRAAGDTADVRREATHRVRQKHLMGIRTTAEGGLLVAAPPSAVSTATRPSLQRSTQYGAARHAHRTQHRTAQHISGQEGDRTQRKCLLGGSAPARTTQ